MILRGGLRCVLASGLLLASAAVSFGDPSISAGASVDPAGTQYGPAAALDFEAHYRGDVFAPNVLLCYPKAVGIPLSDTENIIPMTESLWTPTQLIADFRKRMASIPPSERKEGIIVMLKTERCACKPSRLCSVTTAALEKRSTPLVERFLIYGVQLKPRDGDSPAGTLKIETGADAWKNQAAGKYLFKQGPGATLAFLDPEDGEKMAISNAALLGLNEENFVKNGGRSPALHFKLQKILDELRNHA